MQDRGGQRELKRTYDSDEYASLTTLLAESIAEYRDTDPLDPDFALYESIDTDALDDFVTSVTGTELRTEFHVAGVIVCLRKTTDDEIVVSVQSSDA